MQKRFPEKEGGGERERRKDPYMFHYQDKCLKWNKKKKKKKKKKIFKKKI
jgi:hypothetical protein